MSTIEKCNANITWADVADFANDELLVDLQRTTEILKRSKKGNGVDPTEARDIEPLYQEQTRSYSSDSQNVLSNIEQMLDDYSQKRSWRDERSPTNAASPVERPSVRSLFSELDRNSSSSYNERSTKMSSNVSNVDLPMPIALPLSTSSRVPEQIDSMLGTLQKDMSKFGINTIPKGDCASCEKPIIGEVVIALGKMWHPEHFVCCQCGDELGHRNFFERAGRAYCENHYHDMFSPRCASCNAPIKDRCITALDQTFHPEHFVCAECGQEFGEDGFHEKNGLPYCKSDFFQMFAPKCNGCNNPIQRKFITALGTHWHPECFVCQECGRPFDLGNFYELNHTPLCEMHYHEKRGSLCAACQKPISGRCVSAMGQKFHPEHFCCTYCRQQLNKGTFKEVDRKPFCHKCYQTTHA